MVTLRKLELTASMELVVCNLENRRRIVEELLNVGKITFSDSNRTEIFTLDLAETLGFDATSFEARCSVRHKFFQMCGEVLVIFSRDVLERITNQVNNEPLHGNFRENCLRALLKPRHSVH